MINSSQWEENMLVTDTFGKSMLIVSLMIHLELNMHNAAGTLGHNRQPSVYKIKQPKKWWKEKCCLKDKVDKLFYV